MNSIKIKEKSALDGMTGIDSENDTARKEVKIPG